MLAKVGILTQFAVDGGGDVGSTEIGDLVRGDNHRAHRHEGVEVLAEIGLASAALSFRELDGPGADIVEDGVAEDMVERVRLAHVLRSPADDHPEFHLIVDLEAVGPLDDAVVGGNDDVLARADDGGRELDEID